MFGGHWWVANYAEAGRYIELVSHVFWVIFSICLHELGHGWAALRQGDGTPRRLDRMNMNPLVHMGAPSLLVFAIVGIAWGMMPVDPSRFRSGRMGDVLVAAAGPAVNFALAIGCLILLVPWVAFGPMDANVGENVATFLFIGAWLNLVLGLFNLLPAPPLDGSRILAGLFRPFELIANHPNAPLFGLFVIVALMMTGGIGLLFYGTRQVIDAITSIGVGVLS